MSNNNKEKEQPIIIVKKKGKGHAGGHGGSWKVAFADFATAMMAFFLVMWLMANTTPVEKKAIAAYFSRPDSFQAIISHASPNIINTHADVANTLSSGSSDSIDDQQLMYNSSDQLQGLQKQLDEQFDDSEAMSQYRDQILVDVTPLGLRVQVLDNALIPMFESGSADLNDNIEGILRSIAPSLNQMDNKIIIEGYTDALSFSNPKYKSNWELSASRANAARRALIAGGLDESHISEVVGRASTVLYNPDKPGDPSNRRISVLILNKDAEALLSRQEAINRPPATNPVTTETKAKADDVSNASKTAPQASAPSEPSKPETSDKPESATAKPTTQPEPAPLSDEKASSPQSEAAAPPESSAKPQ